MKKSIIFFILLGIAVFIGSFMAKDTGYVLIAYQNLRLETSLWVALIFILLLFILSYILMRMLYHTKTLPHKLKRWHTQTQQKQIAKIVQLGTQAYLEKNFKVAEKCFSQLARRDSKVLIYYILAAQAAQAQHHYSARDSYLVQAHKQIKNADFAIQMEKTNLYLKANQQEFALAILKKLYKEHPKHPYLMHQLSHLYANMEDWTSLKQLLVPLKKSKTLSKDALLHLEIETYQNILKQSQRSLTDLQTTWKSMPKYLQENIDLLKTYVPYLFKHNEILIALSLIETVLKRHWNGDLLKLYSLHAYKDVKIQLHTAQKWLTRRPKDFLLFFTIGRLYCHNHQWSEAKHYLEKSIDLSPEPFTYQLLGQVEEQLGHKDSALIYYRNGLTSFLKD
jgi:HemY protein